MPSLVGERQFWRHFRRQFGRGELRVKNCRETVGSQFLPRDIKVSRRALWAWRGPRTDPPTPAFSFGFLDLFFWRFSLFFCCVWVSFLSKDFEVRIAFRDMGSDKLPNSGNLGI